MIKKNIFTIIIALIILYLSLASSLTFSSVGFMNISYIDKIGHFCLYFILMSAIIFEHKKSFRNTRQLLLVALVPFFFGILMEVLQITITSDRKGEILDALANSAGITTSIFLWLIIKPYHNEEIR